MATSWEYRYAQRIKGMQSSAVREILKVTSQPDVISFAGGMPAPELFPIQRIEEACVKVLREQGAKALQYNITEGYIPLREFIVEKMGRYGIVANVDNVLITTGSQQALDLVAKVLLDPGDVIIVEAPTFVGALQSFRAYQASYASVPLDDDGMMVDLLAQKIVETHPKFMYVLPNFHNPGGVTLSEERREQVVSLAHQYGVPILEDDPYGELRFEGEYLEPLVVISARQNGGDPAGYFKGDVVYMSTFSKTVAPGLRLGWVVAPAEVVEKLVQAKQGADLHTSSLDQMMVYEVVRDGFLEEHVKEIREMYRLRRDAMLAAMDQHFPKGTGWTRPQGGLFLWVTLPEGVDCLELIEAAVEQRVAFVPGTAFYADGRGRDSLRLTFATCPTDMIDEGIKRLGKAIAKRMKQVA
ncbi:MAG TPA: PLP-dependent aminotransferase family protein [Chloroflexi bacterium]|nr:PLP-dependent aminotransferase family protein [Chloroflexota bacterium]